MWLSGVLRSADRIKLNHMIQFILWGSTALSLFFVSVHLYRLHHFKTADQVVVQAVASSRYVEDTSQFLYDRCCRYMMDQHPFLVADYTLQDLANAVYTNKVYLSKTINYYSGKNFRQYLNYYRIMYALDLFRKDRSLRIQDLSDLSGFRSTTCFLRCFKSVMGEQPSHWCARVRNKLLK